MHSNRKRWRWDPEKFYLSNVQGCRSFEVEKHGLERQGRKKEGQISNEDFEVRNRLRDAS